MCFRSIFLALFLLVSFVSVFSQANPPTQSPTDEQIAKARRRVVGPPKITKLGAPVVNVSLVGTKVLPLVEVKINGRGPYRLLVDSAANVTMLQMRVADELKLKVLRPGETSKLLAVDTLQIGAAQFQDLVIGARSWKEDIDGVLGFNVFEDCLMTLDYPHQILRMQKGTLSPVNGKDIFKYGLDNRSPTLNVLVGKERLTLLIDTGAVSAVVMPENMASKFSFTNGLRDGPRLSTFETAKSTAKQGRLAGDITMGAHVISGLTIHVWSNDPPLIGSRFFQDFIITFDQKTQTIKITV